MPQTEAYIVWPVIKQYFMYAAVPGGDPRSSCQSVALSESATVSGSVICIPGIGVYTSHCAKHTTIVDPWIDAWYIAFYCFELCQ